MIEAVLNVHEATCKNIIDLYNQGDYENMREHIEELDDQLTLIRALIKEL